MGRRVKRHAKLLERMFSRQEWEYLKRNEQFQQRLESANETLDDVESLSLLGDRLLRKWEDFNPKKAKFQRTKSSGLRSS
jgi:hypothetical protein